MFLNYQPATNYELFLAVISLHTHNGESMSCEIMMFVCNRVAKSREILMFVRLQKDAKQCCDASRPESIHTKDESKRGIAFAFIFGVN